MDIAAIQQINLYQPIFRQKKERLTAKTLQMASLVLIAALVAVSLYQYWLFWGLKQAKQTTQQQYTESTQQLEEARQLYPSQARDKSLDQHIQRLSAEIVTKRQVLDVLATRSYGNIQGFAEHLEGLARQRIEGLWLTELSIRDGGSNMGLKGSTLKPELVPQLLQRLSSETAFAGTEFKTFLMQRPKNSRQQIDFNLQTTVEEQTQP